MSPLPTAVTQLPPPKPILPEGREAEQGHKRGLTSPMLTQHPATAQARGASEGLVGGCQGSPPGPGWGAGRGTPAPLGGEVRQR